MISYGNPHIIVGPTLLWVVYSWWQWTDNYQIFTSERWLDTVEKYQQFPF